MSKQKRSKLTASITPDRTIRPKPFVQIEGELTQAQLEAISGGPIDIARGGGGHGGSDF